MRSVLAVCMVVLSVCQSCAQDLRTVADLTRQAALVKPAPNELKWQRIPWVLDLAAAQRIAQAEHRPIFLWVSGDDPLERC